MDFRCRKGLPRSDAGSGESRAERGVQNRAGRKTVLCRTLKESKSLAHDCDLFLLRRGAVRLSALVADAAEEPDPNVPDQCRLAERRADGACGRRFLYLFGALSDRAGNRRLPCALTLSGFGIAYGLSTLFPNHVWVAYAFIMVAGLFVKAVQAPFWAMPSLVFPPGVAGGARGMINGVGNLGGFVGPAVVGWLTSKTGDMTCGIYFLTGTLILGAILTMLMPGITAGFKPEAGGKTAGAGNGTTPSSRTHDSDSHGQTSHRRNPRRWHWEKARPFPKGLRALDSAARKFGVELDCQWFEFASCDYYLRHGKMLPGTTGSRSSAGSTPFSSARWAGRTKCPIMSRFGVRCSSSGARLINTSIFGRSG